jgi:transposase
MLYEDKKTSEVFLKFLLCLKKDAKKKVFFIVDNLRVHHSRVVRYWLSKEENSSRLELFFLPSYFPELNPEGRLNIDLKGQFRSGPVAFAKLEVKRKIRSRMKIIQNNSARVKKYFEDPKNAYAA